MKEQEILKMKDITKYFPGSRALNKVSFSLQKGKVHGLVGENGAGKSTLLKILTGILMPDEGQIYIRGKKTYINNAWTAKKNRIALIPQEPVLCENMTVASNVCMGLETLDKFYFIDYRQLNSNTERLLSLIGSSVDSGELVENLNIEEKTIVAIAKVMALEPEIIAMDEVTSPFDGPQTEKLFKVMSSLKSKGISIIFISHKLEEIFQISDQITILRNGEMIDTLDTHTTTKEQVVDLMIGKKISNYIFKGIKARDTNKKTIFEVKTLSKNGYLRNINFKLYEGEILGITGLKGSGIFELAECIFGTKEKDNGIIFVNGSKVFVKTPADSIKAGIGMIARDRQRHGLVICRSIMENIGIIFLKFFSYLGLLIRTRFLKESVCNIIESLKIVPYDFKRKVIFLSGGNQQKTSIAKWLIRDELQILIFCEPTRGVDIGSKEEIYRIIKEISKKRGIIIISIEIPEILRLSERILVMKNGEIVKELDREEASEEKIMKYVI